MPYFVKECYSVAGVEYDFDDDDYSDSSASYMNTVEVNFGMESVSDNSSANMYNMPALPPLESGSVNVPNNTVELPSAQSSPPAPKTSKSLTMDARDNFKAAPLLSRSQLLKYLHSRQLGMHHRIWHAQRNLW
jgi:hypothetical protein